ncbi:MAG: iron-sulfur cluster assembly protein, partial [Acetobacteraceae bacterium]
MAVSEAPTETVSGLDAHSIIEVLNEIPHPDTGIGIVDLGLIYGVEVQGRDVRVRMTMMQPDNPSRGLLIDEVET